MAATLSLSGVSLSLPHSLCASLEGGERERARQSGGKKAVEGAQSWSAKEAGREDVDFGRVWCWGTGRMVGVGEWSVHGEKYPNLALSTLRFGNNTFRRGRIEDV